jgi:hypothetical protein
MLGFVPSRVELNNEHLLETQHASYWVQVKGKEGQRVRVKKGALWQFITIAINTELPDL